MPSTDPQPSTSKPDGLFRRTLRRRLVPILTRWALLTVALMCTVWVLRAGPYYRALSILRVDPKVVDLYNLKGGDAEPMGPFLQTQVQLITSPNVLTAAGTNPKAAVLKRVQKAGDVVQELRDAVKVTVIPNTYLIEVSMTSDNGLECATIVNAVVDAFMEANGEWSDGMTRIQIKNLEQYLVDLRNQTDELERKWKQLAAKGDRDINPLELKDEPGRVSITTEEYRQIRQELTAVRLELAQAQAWLATAKDAVKRAGANPAPVDEREMIDQRVKRQFQLDPEVVALVAEIRKAEAKFNEARRLGTTPGDAAVVKAKRKLDDLVAQHQKLFEAKQAVIREQIELGGDGEVREAQFAVSKLQARQVALTSQFSQLDVKRRMTATDEVEITLIQEERKTIKEMQVAVTRRLEQLRYEAKGEARIRPVNPNGAMVPTRPYYDRRPLLLTIIPFATFALVFAFFAGVEAWSASKARVKPEPAKAEVKPEGEAPVAD